jgi:hypothetical protein
MAIFCERMLDPWFGGRESDVTQSRMPRPPYRVKL